MNKEQPRQYRFYKESKDRRLNEKIVERVLEPETIKNKIDALSSLIKRYKNIPGKEQVVLAFENLQDALKKELLQTENMMGMTHVVVKKEPVFNESDEQQVFSKTLKEIPNDNVSNEELKTISNLLETAREEVRFCENTLYEQYPADDWVMKEEFGKSHMHPFSDN